MAIPAFLKYTLWSYDLAKMDRKRDAEVVITQVLNYGDQKAIKWLFASYTPNQIKKVLLQPTRGVWFREKLRKWLGFFNLMIDPLTFEAAIREFGPRRKLIEEVFRRKGFVIDEIPSASTHR